MAGGQVYVTVQADASNYKARSVAASSGAASFGATITWSFNGGISGQYGWESPKKVNYVDGDVAATNAAVRNAYQGATLTELLKIADCVQFN